MDPGSRSYQKETAEGKSFLTACSPTPEFQLVLNFQGNSHWRLLPFTRGSPYPNDFPRDHLFTARNPPLCGCQLNLLWGPRGG